jgi:tellurite resistance protein TerC
VSFWVWLIFGVFVVAMFAIDLIAFNRGGGEISLRRAAIWSVAWTALGALVALPLFFAEGGGIAQEYLTGFLIEKSLSTDNLFVFALLLGYFAVPRRDQRRVLFWGIIGALFLRGVFILLGAALLNAFHATIYLFGAFLIFTGARMARREEIDVKPERNLVLKAMRRVVPMTGRYHGDRFVVKENGRRRGTPLLAALALVAAFDVAFAVDSSPAIFAVTRDTFVVFAANALSLLGLASLYFVLAGLLVRFVYLNVGLALVLVLVGIKMTLSDLVSIPVWLSLLVIVAVLALTIVASLLFASPDSPPSETKSDSP